MGKNFTRIVFLLFFLFLSVADRLTAQTNCETPVNLTAANISPTGAVLYLGTTGTTGTFNIRYHGPNTTTWTTLNNVTIPFQLGGLMCGTAYEWQAQRVCGVTPNNAPVLSAWSSGAAFTTSACTAPTCPVPTNLTSTNISQNGAVLSFGANSTNGVHNIRYRSSNSATWIAVNNVTMPFQLGNLTCHTAYEWQAQKVCTTTAGTDHVLSDWSASVTFTTTACPETTPCPVPSNLTASNISQTGAVLHFGSSTASGRYNIRYHGPNSTTWIMLNNVTVPFQLGNLTCHTTYEWQAQQICANSAGTGASLSDWSLGAAFTTAACPTTTCPVPTYLSTTNISQTGAVLNLGTLANTGTFNIRYRVPNAPNFIVISNVTMPYQLRELTCHTAYEWQAQKVCSNADNSTTLLSDWSVAVAFTTANCPEQTCPVPTNLAATNITQTGAVLHFGSTTATGVYNIRYHGPNSTAWITVNNVTMPFQLGNLTCGTVYEWQAQQVCATTPGTPPVLSAWSAGSAFTTAGCPAPTCPVPTYLATTSISQTGAVLYVSTSSNSGVYNIRYRVPNSVNWIVINNVTMPYQLRELTCHTAYEWQAQKVCSNADNSTTLLSDWSAAVAFTTTNCPEQTCPVPTNLAATNITQTGAVLHFGSTTATGMYNIRYHAANSATWITVNNVTMPYQLGYLTCHTVYEWQAQRVCANTGSTTPALSPWSVGASFTTANCPTTTCPVPTYLSTTNITQTGAVLNLGPNANTGTFNIRYRVPNSANWIVINNVTMPYQLRELTCHTAYEWQAQKVCSNTNNSTVGLSEWSVAVAFTTANCAEQTCPAPTNLRVSNITPTGAVLHLGTTATAGRYNIRYRGPNFLNWITVTNVTLPFQLRELRCHTSYEWQIQQICGTAAGTVNGLSPWSAGAAFTTANCPTDGCPVPSNLSATHISETGAVLQWNGIPGVTAYVVQYKPANSDLPFITVRTTTNFVQIGGLTAATNYVWHVAAVCQNTGVVVWSPRAFFSTRSSLVAYPNPANQSTSVSFWSDRRTTVDVKVLDLYGKEVIIEQRDAVEGANVFAINTSGVADGLYMIGVYSDGNLTTTKVLIKH